MCVHRTGKSRAAQRKSIVSLVSSSSRRVNIILILTEIYSGKGTRAEGIVIEIAFSIFGGRFPPRLLDAGFRLRIQN